MRTLEMSTSVRHVFSAARDGPLGIDRRRVRRRVCVYRWRGGSREKVLVFAVLSRGVQCGYTRGVCVGKPVGDLSMGFLDVAYTAVDSTDASEVRRRFLCVKPTRWVSVYISNLAG